MPEHRICLRLGWELDPGESRETITRFSLPTRWPIDLTDQIRLIRRFGRPRQQRAEESYQLEMLKVPGLVEVRLNGREMVRKSEKSESELVLIDVPLLERNMLEIEVDLAQVPASTRLEDWGEIALLIVGGSASAN
jgi:hypothetical protein